MITIRIVLFYNIGICYRQITVFPKFCFASFECNNLLLAFQLWENWNLFSLPPFLGNAKDILLLHEEDAKEWALYLREIFIHVVEREEILLYPLHSFSFSHLESLHLNAYRCKLLILSNNLLKDLTPKKCQFLEKILHSMGSVVTLLCGMESSDPFYRLLNIPRKSWEISTEQEPDDYLSVIRQILDQGRDAKPFLTGFKC